jgi:uncharacterized membrane protein
MALNTTAANGATHRVTHAVRPDIRQLGVADLRAALAQGWADFSENRTDVLFLCVIYPVVGLALGRLVYGGNVLPLLFPLAGGFALLGPFAAVGLYELSRRHEQGLSSTWRNAFDVAGSRSLGAILLLGAVLCGLFLIWLQVAQGIYELFMGGTPTTDIGQFLRDVLTTSAGWAMIVVGDLVGLVFATAAFTISVVSFPLLVDREMGATTAEKVSVAVDTSLRAVRANPLTMAAWALIVAALLVAGSIPFLIGLTVVMPVLGHASWHLYRRVVVR